LFVSATILVNKVEYKSASKRIIQKHDALFYSFTVSRQT